MTLSSSKHSDLRTRVAKATAVSTVLLLAAGAGTAYASWTAEGGGAGSAAASDMHAIGVEAFVPGDSPRSALIPGGEADLVLRLSNSNPYPVRIDSVTGAGLATADADHPGCTTTGVAFRPPAASSIPATSIAADSTTLITLAKVVGMDTTSKSACQGATFHIPVSVVVRK